MSTKGFGKKKKAVKSERDAIWRVRIKSKSHRWDSAVITKNPPVMIRFREFFACLLGRRKTKTTHMLFQKYLCCKRNNGYIRFVILKNR